MKYFKNNILRISFFLILLLIYPLDILIISENETLQGAYRFRVILQKTFSDENIEVDSMFNIVKIPGGIYTDNFSFVKDAFGFGYYSPRLFYIDKDTNYYIHNPFQCMKIFDKEGRFLYNIDYPSYYTIGNFPGTKNNELYLVLKRNTDTSKIINNMTIGICYNMIDNSIKEIDYSELININKTLNFDKIRYSNDLNKIKAITDKKINFYDIRYSAGDYSLFEGKEGKICVPENIDIYKFDYNYYLEDFSFGYPKKNIIFNFNIPEFDNSKFIYVKGVYIDSTGNIYLSGIKSNTTDKIERKEYDVEFKSIRVYNPIYFLWKLEKIN